MSKVPTIGISGEALDAFFTEVLRAAYSIPQLAKVLRELDRFVQEQSETLKQVNGMSTQGHMMILGAMPNQIYAFVRKAARERLGISDIWRDNDNMRRFMKIWSKARVKTRPKDRMWLRNGRATRV